MPTFFYPENAVLTTAEQVLAPTLTMDDILFQQIMPIDNQDSDILMWEQEDDFVGLQQVRGLNGEPPKVQPTGAKTYIMQPGYYGEHGDIDEKQLTQRRKYGTFNQPIDISDLVGSRQRQLLSREIDRIRYIGWTLLSTGTFSVLGPNGATLHTDTFSLQTYDATTWSNASASTPLADLRAVQALGPAYGTNFGVGSLAIMNRKTSNYLLANTNAADLGGKRTGGLANVLSIKDVNQLTTGEDLPDVVIYDKGYKNDSGTFTRFIPDNKVIIIGIRPGNAPVAKYLMTRNANRDDLGPGPYAMVEDTMDSNKPPRYIRVHRGHNGGPVIIYPGSIVIADVS